MNESATRRNWDDFQPYRIGEQPVTDYSYQAPSPSLRDLLRLLAASILIKLASLVITPKE